ncbi:MAG: DUF2059 domain-containing protein [Erythrobacter sp.]
MLAAAAGLAAITPTALAAQDMAEEAMAAEASAQGEGNEMEQAMAMLGGMFPATPLTAEQEARLPQATRIITRMIPDGTMGEMMGSMFDSMLGPLMATADAPAMDAVMKGTGISGLELDLSAEQAAELAALFDPAFAERHEREKAALPTLMRDMMTVMEPTMRKAMSELYAIHFSQAELDGIEAFFLTDIGTAYARKSFTMSSDPRIISASLEAMPQLMGSFASMEQKMAEATADLPARRGFAELSAKEKARVARLVGRSVAEIDEIAAANASE